MKTKTNKVNIDLSTKLIQIGFTHIQSARGVKPMGEKHTGRSNRWAVRHKQRP